jgi:hypothetical protein
MRRSRLLPALAVVLLVPAGAVAALSTALRPSERIGAVTLVSVPEASADSGIFTFCRPEILDTGRYRRTCTVPRTKLLFLGYGAFETSRAKLDDIWRQLRWTMTFDGRAVDLRAFGTEDRVLRRYAAAGGRTAYLRAWKVAAENLPPGRHTLRYTMRQSGYGTTDATWTFVVGS